MDQKVNIGRVSKIVNFHPIDLKFEEDLYLVIELNHQLFLRSNLFYGFCKYRALHDVVFLLLAKTNVFTRMLVCLFVQTFVCPFVCDPSRAHGFDRNDLNIFQVIA